MARVLPCSGNSLSVVDARPPHHAELRLRQGRTQRPLGEFLHFAGLAAPARGEVIGVAGQQAGPCGLDLRGKTKPVIRGPCRFARNAGRQAGGQARGEMLRRHDGVVLEQGQRGVVELRAYVLAAGRRFRCFAAEQRIHECRFVEVPRHFHQVFSGNSRPCGKRDGFEQIFGGTRTGHGRGEPLRLADLGRPRGGANIPGAAVVITAQHQPCVIRLGKRGIPCLQAFDAHVRGHGGEIEQGRCAHQIFVRHRGFVGRLPPFVFQRAEYLLDFFEAPFEHGQAQCVLLAKQIPFGAVEGKRRGRQTRCGRAHGISS